ncbi:MAG: GNAT family N-acetyltransferase [Micromonosporaceae bacterium]|nr:GNAT family N-acetyltransferase [Micromonosporaceae bacterium]
MTELPIRPATAEDWPAISGLMSTAFHETFDEETHEIERSVFEPDRSLVIYDPDRGGPLVAHAAAFTRDLTVPGETVPAAHVSLVGVLSTHRRRGLLTRLMHRQLPELPEPVAVLWASEGRIYPRFGYGLASQKISLSADTREVRLPHPAEPGRLRTVPPTEARGDLARLYEAARPDRPGWSSRSDAWWSYRLADPASHRHGATERRVTLHESNAGEVDGYALWRAKSDWSTAGPQGEVQVAEAIAADPDAYLALWRFLFSIDLTRTVTLRLAGLAEPLLHLADEPRRLGVTLGDGLFIRIVDLPAALTARRYAAPLDLVLEVTDPLLPRNAGRWRLTVTAGGDKATCVRVDEPADLACDTADLAAAYLGGGSLAALGAAGRVRELRPDALAAASTGFGWHQAPAGIEVF